MKGNRVDILIGPDNMNHASVKAFFTGKVPGADPAKIGAMLSIARENIYLPVQKHTDRVHIIDGDLTQQVADAVVTDRAGILLGVRVADCVPILLLDKKNTVIGAVHAGWRGTATQIIRKTIHVMVEHFHSSPSDIMVALGPSVRGNCYQVDADVMDAIAQATGDGDYYVRADEKFCIDLVAVNRLQAVSLGIPGDNIWSSDECTHCKPEKYYSYRYSGQYNGSQGGFIGIV
jgi:polyphenol oxidase